MTGMMPNKKPNGEWVYPASGEVLETAGLYTIDNYAKVRRNTILRFVSQRPIYKFSTGAEQLRSTGNRQYWWEQLMDLEETSPVKATEEGFGDFAGA